MNIALIGYGKMGKAIERIAMERNHEIVLRITQENLKDFTQENLKSADVAIEFSQPEAAFENVSTCLQAGVSVVCGTTGWNKQFAEAQDNAKQSTAALIQASNFSVGVNIFFEVNKMLAGLMKNYVQYDVSVEETHHTQKLDAPSGTAITVAEQILSELPRKNKWVKETAGHAEDLAIKSFRVDEVPGTHIVKYSSEIDDIEIMHTAHSRDGFALGAVLAAEFIQGKIGVFTMRDVLFNH